MSSARAAPCAPVPWVGWSSRTVWAGWTWSAAARRPTAARCPPGWASWWRCTRAPGTCWCGSGRRSSPPPRLRKPAPGRAGRPAAAAGGGEGQPRRATPSSRAWCGCAHRDALERAAVLGEGGCWDISSHAKVVLSLPGNRGACLQSKLARV